MVQRHRNPSSSRSSSVGRRTTRTRCWGGENLKMRPAVNFRRSSAAACCPLPGIMAPACARSHFIAALVPAPAFSISEIEAEAGLARAIVLSGHTKPFIEEILDLDRMTFIGQIGHVRSRGQVLITLPGQAE